MDPRVIQTNSWTEGVFRTTVRSPATFKEQLPAPGKPWQKHVAETFRCGLWVVPSWWVVVCTSAEVIANCVAQIGALNTAEPLSDGYTVQAQHGDIEHSQWMTSLRIWLIND